MALGVPAGDYTWVKKGAIAALYLYGIQYAQEHGYARVNFGVTPSFLQDGLLRFTRKWGAVIVPSPTIFFDYLVQWQPQSPTVAAFLVQTPLVCRHRGELAALTAVTDEHPPAPGTLQKLQRTLFAPGLRRLVVLTDGEPAPGNVTTVDAAADADQASPYLPLVCCTPEQLWQEG